jgi:hypothetical protein
MPHRVVPHTWSFRLQHHLGDLVNLERSLLVSGTNAQISKRDERRSLKNACDQVSVVSRVSALQRDCRFGILPPLQHEPSPRRLENSKRPVLAVSLGRHDSELCRLVCLLTPVERVEDRRSAPHERAVGGDPPHRQTRDVPLLRIARRMVRRLGAIARRLEDGRVARLQGTV